MPALEEALRLNAAPGGVRVAFADPLYEAMNGMFGGWTAAILLRAGIEAAGAQRTPSAFTVNFLSKIEPGIQVHVRKRRMETGRSIDHWRLEARAATSRRVLASALLIATDRQATDGHTEPAVPVAPEPGSLPSVHPPGPFGQRFDLRPVHGFPPFGLATTESLAWVRETSNRPVDHVQLALLADCQPPRSFYWSQGFRPSATLTLSLYFFASASEMAEVGDDFVLIESVGTRGANSLSGQRAQLWSRSGNLLATTEQLCWFR